MMAEGRALAAGQYRRHPPPMICELTGTDHVNTAMKAVQPAGFDAASHLTLGETQGIELPHSDHAVLARRRLRDAGEGLRASEALFRQRWSVTRRAPEIRPPDHKENQA